MTPSARPILALIAASALALLLWAVGALEPLERPLYDLRVTARFLMGPPSQAAARLAVVAVDESSLEALGPWPWSWNLHARLVERVAEAGAAAMALDVILAEPPEPGMDQELAAAMTRAARSMPVFLPAGTEAPHPTLSRAVTALGSIRFPLDPDGVVRRLPRVLEPGGPEPLALLLARASGADGPWESDPLWLDLRRPPLLASPLRVEHLFPTFSYASVLEGRVPGEALQGRLVLVGATASGLGDRHLTAFSRLGPIPGVLLHANAVRALLDPQPVRRSPLATIALVLGSAGAAVLLLRRPTPVLLAPLGLLFAYTAAAFTLFAGRGLFVDLVPAAIALGGGQLLIGLEAYRAERHRRARVEETFGRYVSPAVLRELLRPDAPLGPAGRRLTVTLLVTDLCRFTAFAESRPPEETVEALNVYLQAMVHPVLEAGGLVDKYLGDGFLSLFGAPLADTGHARRALEAADGIRRALAQVDADRRAAGKPTFQTRIALHTGEVVAGTVGSPERLEYTAVGDPVNLVFRLEKAAAPGEVLATEAVLRAAGLTPAPPWQGPEPLMVRGRDAPAVVYRLPAPTEDSLLV